MKRLALGLISVYQLYISPAMAPRCRFVPSCSQYTSEAIAKFGIFKGGWLGFKRLVRCNPFMHGGYDPVP